MGGNRLFCVAVKNTGTSIMESAKQLAAIGFIVTGIAVLAMTMSSGKYGGGPLLPQAVPYLGAPFGLGLLAAQAAFCLLCDAKDGLIWMAAVCLIALPLALFGNAMNLYPEAMSGIDRLITGPSCASAIALGAGVVNGKR
jgi:hypothetical protein